MGKKSNTLNDLSKFLESEQHTSSLTLPIEEKDYFKKKPLSFVAIDIEDFDINEDTKAPKDQEVKKKFIDSKVMRKTSFEDVEDQIKTLALENNMTVQQVISSLYLNNTSSFSFSSFFQWHNNFQKTYWQFWSDFQKSVFKINRLK